MDNFELPDVASTILRGNKETLSRPPVFACSEDTHHPFIVGNDSLDFQDQHGLMLWGIVRTVGAHFDGDRTDIHDIFPIVWSSVIRAFGIASPSLIYEDHGFVPGEIGACHIAFTQCPWRITEDNFHQARKSMVGWTAFGFHLLDDVFQWHRINTSSRPDKATQEELRAKWVSSIGRHLKNPKDTSKSKRKFPNWQYFSSREKGLTAFRMPQVRVKALKRILSPFSPEYAKGEESIVLLANGIPNAIPYQTLKLGNRLLNIAEDGHNERILVIPIDSHCIFLGSKTVIAIEGDFGRRPFQKEQEYLFKRRENENRVFYAESSLQWNTPLSAASLENLCLELVLREPGVIRAKPVGNTNDRDGGRDVVIDWKLPDQHHVESRDNSKENNSVSGGVKVRRIIAQVKYRSKTIGKRDVQDIRDTLEHYEADGYLLIAYPKISSSLFDHLDKLRNRTQLMTDWWDMGELEGKLRQHPDIARRYPDIIQITF